MKSNSGLVFDVRYSKEQTQLESGSRMLSHALRFHGGGAAALGSGALIALWCWRENKMLTVHLVNDKGQIVCTYNKSFNMCNVSILDNLGDQITGTGLQGK